jgi:hypothetical protein
MTTISIEVDTDIAQNFLTASASEKDKLQLLLNLRLKELMANPHRPLMEIMDDIGTYAESQGMTAELLESLLHEK